jgi:nitrogen fixation protein FixH
LVVTVLAVNATMVVLAINTNPGLVRADYYEGGREVERTIVTRLEGGPGWTMNIDTPADLLADSPTTIRFFIVDKAGQPVTVEAVNFFAYRPANSDQDIAMAMEQEAPGRYAVRLAFPLAGIWDTLVSARDGDQEYSVAQRISVARP